MVKEIKSSEDYGKASVRQRLYRFTAPLRIHRLNWLTLFGAFVLLTGSSTWIYYKLSTSKGPEEISSTCNKSQSACLAGESLYFSIATETTVGYGDLSPLGWARVVACVQALLGLMLAGLFLGKIGSLPTRATRQLIEKCTGSWIEISEARRTVISLVTISYKDSLVHYCGANFDSSGNRLRNLVGHIEPAKFKQGSNVAFRYTNEDNFDDFYEGTTTLSFVEENIIAKRFTRFTGFAKDTRHGKIKMCGYRVLKKDERRFCSKDNEVRGNLAREYLHNYEVDRNAKSQSRPKGTL